MAYFQSIPIHVTSRYSARKGKAMKMYSLKADLVPFEVLLWTSYDCDTIHSENWEAFIIAFGLNGNNAIQMYQFTGNEVNFVHLWVEIRRIVID